MLPEDNPCRNIMSKLKVAIKYDLLVGHLFCPIRRLIIGAESHSVPWLGLSLRLYSRTAKPNAIIDYLCLNSN